MKLVLILLTVMLFRLSATESYSQSARISLKMTDTTVKEVLKGIENRSEFTFYYNDDLINSDKQVSLDAENESISDILRSILPNCEFTISNKNVIITPKPVAAASQQQEKPLQVWYGM